MSLNKIMAQDEIAAIQNLIAAHLTQQKYESCLRMAIERKNKAADTVTRLMFKESDSNNNEFVKAMPESMVVEYDGQHYFVKLDTDGDNCHQITLTAGVLTQ